MNGSTSSLTLNALNQLSGRSVPGRLEVRGEVVGPVQSVGVSVLREGDPGPRDYDPAELMGNRFYFGATVDNDIGPFPASIRVEPSTTVGGNEFFVAETRTELLPQTPEAFEHDEDGNMTRDGLREFVWDTENRMVEVIMRRDIHPGGILPAAAKFSRVKNHYDHQNRRVQKDVYLPAGTGEVLARRVKFVWDEMNMVMEVEQHIAGADTTRLVTRTYHTGPDLSGTEQGAGGVGGLLSCILRDDDWSGGTYVGAYLTLLPCYDGNGNIVSYVDTATGAVEQEEEYGPFGENLRPRSTSPKRVPFGWSTKYTDEETGLVAYQLRYYNPELGRWMSRDPIEEAGGVNLMGFIGNQTPHGVDFIGLQQITFSRSGTEKSGQRLTLYKLSNNKETADGLVEMPMTITLPGLISIGGNVAGKGGQKAFRVSWTETFKLRWHYNGSKREFTKIFEDAPIEPAQFSRDANINVHPGLDLINPTPLKGASLSGKYWLSEKKLTQEQQWQKERAQSNNEVHPFPKYEIKIERAKPYRTKIDGVLFNCFDIRPGIQWSGRLKVNAGLKLKIPFRSKQGRESVETPWELGAGVEVDGIGSGDFPWTICIQCRPGGGK